MEERNTTAGVLIQDGKYLIAKRVEGGPVGGLWEFVGENAKMANHQKKP